MPENPYAKKRHPKRGRFKNEAEFEQWVIRVAKTNGWLVSSMHNSQKQHWSTDKGIPDLTMVKDNRLVFAELKVHPNRPSPDQKAWLESLKRVPAIEVYTWYDAEEDEIVRILGGKHPLR